MCFIWKAVKTDLVSLVLGLRVSITNKLPSDVTLLVWAVHTRDLLL